MRLGHGSNGTVCLPIMYQALNSIPSTLGRKDQANHWNSWVITLLQWNPEGTSEHVTPEH
jgi:hypothetical protein